MADKKPGWIKGLAALGVVAAATPLFVVIAWPRIHAYVEALTIGRDTPAVWHKPVALDDESIALAVGAPLEYAGVTFSAPWQVLVDAPARDGKNFATVHFRPSIDMTILYDKHGDVARSVSGVPQPPNMSPTEGVPVPALEFEMDREVLNATPSNIRLWSPRAKIDAQMALLQMKASQVTTFSTGDMHTLATPRFRGFQLSSVEKTRKVIQISLYNDDEIVYLSLFERYPATEPGITQGDVNLIVQTLRPTN
jgi:hypothetical protein